jgi:integrase
MSTQQYETKDGRRWRVRWRDGSGKQMSRSFLSHRDAQAFDLDVRARKLRGEGAPHLGRKTLGSVYDDWLRLDAPILAPATLLSYQSSWRAHIEPELGERFLSELVTEPQLFDEFIATMRDGEVGAAAQRKAFIVLSALLSAAVSRNQIAANPLWRRKKRLPPLSRRHSRPLAPITIERLRHEIRKRQVKRGSSRATGDALLVSLMAYAGLRPGEALALNFGDLTTVVRVDKSASFGEERDSKTAKRTCPLIAPLVADIVEWRSVQGDPADTARVFGDRDGELWSLSAWNNWRSRVWKPALATVAGDDPELAALLAARPYDLRGSCVSLRLRAGEPPLEIARTTGHSPAVMFNHYAGVIEELRGQTVLSAEEQVLRARQLVSEATTSELDKLVGETLKSPDKAGRTAQSLLYGPRRIRKKGNQ